MLKLVILLLALSTQVFAEDLALEWDLYTQAGSVTHLDIECTQGILDNPIPWILMNTSPILVTDTTFVAQIATGGLWFCRVNAISVDGNSNTMKGIWKLIIVKSPGGTRTP